MAGAHFRVSIKGTFIAVDELKDQTESRPMRRCFSDSCLHDKERLGCHHVTDQAIVVETSKQMLTKHGLKTQHAMPSSSSGSSSAWADEVDDCKDVKDAPSQSSQSNCPETVHLSSASLPAGTTTLMLRHLPRYAYNTKSLQEEIKRAGFLHVLDFIYVPPDLKKHRNRGFAFLNFVHESYATKFLEAYDGKQLSAGTKSLSVCAANMQGLAALWKLYHGRGSEELIPGYEPVFLNVRVVPVTRPTTATAKPQGVPSGRRRFVQPDVPTAQ